MKTNDNPLRELTPGECDDTHGGIWMEVAAGLAIAIGVSIINDWDSFTAGLMGLRDPAKPSPKLP